jgi:hypothetical protein
MKTCVLCNECDVWWWPSEKSETCCSYYIHNKDSVTFVGRKQQYFFNWKLPKWISRLKVFMKQVMITSYHIHFNSSDFIIFTQISERFISPVPDEMSLNKHSAFSKKHNFQNIMKNASKLFRELFPNLKQKYQRNCVTNSGHPIINMFATTVKLFSRNHVQGASNMTGTNCDLFTHKSSRSYLNHLVFRWSS